MINAKDLDRYHAACKIIEVDGEQGYRTCCERFGTEVANLLLISFARRNFWDLSHYPPQQGFDVLQEQVNSFLKEKGMVHACD